MARLREEFPDSSGRRLRAWLVAGRVRVKGEIVHDPRTPVAPGDPVTLGPAPPPALAAPLRLVHEDDALLVIEKPSGLLTIGTEHERERTAYRMVWAYLKGARPSRRPFIVHRLDRETSGLLVIAKTPETKQYLQAQFFSGTAERRYVAIVEGVVTADEGTLRDVLVEERSLRVRPADPTRPPPKGRRARIAITRYRVVERRADVTRVSLRLGTGRRHQIRVQMAKLGHPVVGDIRHGARRDPLRRLCLHATRLGFRHPDNGAPVEFDCAPPDAFASLGRPADRPASPPAPRQERGTLDTMRRPTQPGWRPPRTGPAARRSTAERASPSSPSRPERNPRDAMRTPDRRGWRPARTEPAPWRASETPASSPPAAGPERDARGASRPPRRGQWQPRRPGRPAGPSSDERAPAPRTPGSDGDTRGAGRPPRRREWQPGRPGPPARPPSEERRPTPPGPDSERGARSESRAPRRHEWQPRRTNRPPWSAEERTPPGPPPGPERGGGDATRRPPRARQWSGRPGAGPRAAERGSPPPAPGAKRRARDPGRRPRQTGWRPPPTGPAPWSAPAERTSPPAPGPERNPRDGMRRPASPGPRRPPRAGDGPPRPWPRERPPRRPPR